jgi:hypothetical protein
MTVGTEEEGTFAAFPDREVDGSGGAWRERDEDGLPTLAQDGEGFDARARGLRIRCSRPSLQIRVTR